jgi:hypothetical protein
VGQTFANARSAVLSIITGGGKWVEMTVHADPLYQHLLLDAREASGHGLRAKRSKSGAISFDLLDQELADAPLQ